MPHKSSRRPNRGPRTSIFGNEFFPDPFKDCPRIRMGTQPRKPGAYRLPGGGIRIIASSPTSGKLLTLEPDEKIITLPGFVLAHRTKTLKDFLTYVLEEAGVVWTDIQREQGSQAHQSEAAERWQAFQHAVPRRDFRRAVRGAIEDLYRSVGHRRGKPSQQDRCFDLITQGIKQAIDAKRCRWEDKTLLPVMNGRLVSNYALVKLIRQQEPKILESVARKYARLWLLLKNNWMSDSLSSGDWAFLRKYFHDQRRPP